MGLSKINFVYARVPLFEVAVSEFHNPTYFPCGLKVMQWKVPEIDLFRKSVRVLIAWRDLVKSKPTVSIRQCLCMGRHNGSENKKR